MYLGPLNNLFLQKFGINERFDMLIQKNPFLKKFTISEKKINWKKHMEIFSSFNYF